MDGRIERRDCRSCPCCRYEITPKGQGLLPAHTLLCQHNRAQEMVRGLQAVIAERLVSDGELAAHVLSPAWCPELPHWRHAVAGGPELEQP